MDGREIMHLAAGSVALNILGEGGVQSSTGLFSSLGIVQMEFICIKYFPCYLLSWKVWQGMEITSCFLLQQDLTLAGVALASGEIWDGEAKAWFDPRNVRGHFDMHAEKPAEEGLDLEISLE